MSIHHQPQQDKWSNYFGL